MLSIILPTYNGGEFLKKYTIPSLRRQTVADWECFIIDDGSTDNTYELIEDISKRDKRIKIIKKKNKALASALNLGVETSTGGSYQS